MCIIVQIKERENMTHQAIKEKQSKNGQYYFTVNAANNKVLATSEMYKTKQAMRNGIKSLCTAILNPMTDDEPHKSIPPRSNVAIRLSTLRSLGIESMSDVAEAMEDGRLTKGDLG